MKTLASVLFLLVLTSSDAVSEDQDLNAASALVFYHLPYTHPPDRAHRLDVYAPNGGENHPVVIWVHGGSWVRGDKSFAQHKPRAFTDKGFVFVPVNYRFVPQVTAADQAEDVAKAIEKHLKAEGLGLSNIKGCISVDVAAYDIPRRYEESGDSLRKTLAMIFGAGQESQKQVSPINHVLKNKNIPPFLVIHIDVNPQKSQSEAFVEKLTAEGISARTHTAGGKGLKTLDEELGLADDESTKAVFEFLGSLLEEEEEEVTATKIDECR